jgi:hypothetical protein
VETQLSLTFPRLLEGRELVVDIEVAESGLYEGTVRAGERTIGTISGDLGDRTSFEIDWSST